MYIQLLNESVVNFAIRILNFFGLELANHWDNVISQATVLKIE